MSETLAPIDPAEADKTTRRLSCDDILYALAMWSACLVSYLVATSSLFRFVRRDDDLLGGMWAVIATIFEFREVGQDSLSAGIARLLSTFVGFVLCLTYLLIFPFSAFGMAALIGISTAVMALLGQRDDTITTGITIAVVMVVAAISAQSPWREPLLRLVDTFIGIAVGVSLRSIVYTRLSSLVGVKP